MRIAAVLGLMVLLASGSAVSLEVAELRFSTTLWPALEQIEETRPWHVGFSTSLALNVSPEDQVVIVLSSDVHLASPSITARYCRTIAGQFTAGGGLTVTLFPQSDGVGPRIDLFASGSAFHAATRLRTEAEAILPILFIWHDAAGWTTQAALALPSLTLSGAARLADQAWVGGRLSLRPMLMDTTVLENPVGRITSNLLLLPGFSGFLIYDF